MLDETDISVRLTMFPTLYSTFSGELQAYDRDKGHEVDPPGGLAEPNRLPSTDVSVAEALAEVLRVPDLPCHQDDGRRQVGAEQPLLFLYQMLLPPALQGGQHAAVSAHCI